MAWATATWAAISAGTAAVGTGVGIAAQRKAAKAERRAARFNADQAELNAEVALEQGRVAEGLVRREGREIIGGMRAARGASGLAMGASLQDVFRQSELDVEMDALATRYNARLQSMGFEAEAGLSRRRGRSAATAGRIGMAAELLSGTARIADIYRNP